MGVYRSALDALAALDVPGATQYSISAVPDVVPRGSLPALLVQPGDVQDERLFKDRGRGFEVTAFSNGPRTISVTVTHLLLTAPVTLGNGPRQHIPALIDAIDAYISALAADVTLGGALMLPARVTVEPGLFEHGSITYHGCAFRHLWLLSLNGGA